MPGCKTTIFASVTGEVGAPANTQFRVNSFLPTLYWYVDQDVIGIGIENDIDSGIGPSLAAHRSLWGIQLCPPRQSDRMSGFAPWTWIIDFVSSTLSVSDRGSQATMSGSRSSETLSGSCFVTWIRCKQTPGFASGCREQRTGASLRATNSGKSINLNV